MEGTKRRRSLSAQEWVRLMWRFATSGMTVSAFCRRERLNEGSFYRWRARVTAERIAKWRREHRGAMIS